MRKSFIRTGSFFAMSAVILGAFGAHTLEAVLEAKQLNTFETAVRYQFYHSLALLFLGLWLYFRKTKTMEYAGMAFILGIVLFSGSLYVLSVREWLNLKVNWLGPITPLGGTFFIIGWAIILYASFQENGRTHKPVSSEE
ncbi:MAG: DUF423 domain-containing protein [Saprospiraceae bacterium]